MSPMCTLGEPQRGAFAALVRKEMVSLAELRAHLGRQPIANAILRSAMIVLSSAGA